MHFTKGGTDVMCWKKIFRETHPLMDAEIASRPRFHRFNGPAQGRAEPKGLITLRGIWVCGKALILLLSIRLERLSRSPSRRCRESGVHRLEPVPTGGHVIIWTFSFVAETRAVPFGASAHVPANDLLPQAPVSPH